MVIFSLSISDIVCKRKAKILSLTDAMFFLDSQYSFLNSFLLKDFLCPLFSVILIKSMLLSILAQGYTAIIVNLILV